MFCSEALACDCNPSSGWWCLFFLRIFLLVIKPDSSPSLCFRSKQCWIFPVHLQNSQTPRYANCDIHENWPGCYKRSVGHVRVNQAHVWEQHPYRGCWYLERGPFLLLPSQIYNSEQPEVLRAEQGAKNTFCKGLLSCEVDCELQSCQLVNSQSMQWRGPAHDLLTTGWQKATQKTPNRR